MVVVTGREFRAGQSKYLGMVTGGEDVIIKSRAGSFRIVPVRQDDAVYNDEQLARMVDRAMKQIKQGQAYAMRDDETPEQFLNRMLTED